MQIRQKHLPKHWLGGGVTSGVRFGLAHSQTACSFLMISPKLHAIWPVLFLLLPQDLIVVLLVFFATLGDG